jgi:hypothetical protein
MSVVVSLLTDEADIQRYRLYEEELYDEELTLQVLVFYGLYDSF